MVAWARSDCTTRNCTPSGTCAAYAQVTPDQHIALAKVFGPLSSGSYFDRHPLSPDLEVITSDRPVKGSK